MALLSTGSKYKNEANRLMQEAVTLQEQQKDIDFRRNLLSNIRQQRIAAAQINAATYSDDVTTSSAAGAMANIDTSLASEVGYVYDATERAEKIQNLTDSAQYYAKKYQKQQKKNAAVGGALGAIGTVVGGLTPFGPLGSFIGGMAGTGLASALGGGRTATWGALNSAAEYGAFQGLGEWMSTTNLFKKQQQQNPLPTYDVSYTADNVRFTNASYPG